MILILGGAYQGKLSFAKGTFNLSSEDVFTCTDAYIDVSKPCIYALEEFTFACIEAGIDPLQRFQTLFPKRKNTVFICQDIFCGVVPMERNLRLWRDATGKLCQYLAGECDSVYRIYCGLEQRLK